MIFVSRWRGQESEAEIAFITDLAGEWACVVRCARTVDRVNNNIKHGTHGQWAKAEVPAGLSYGFHENAISAGFV